MTDHHEKDAANRVRAKQAREQARLQAMQDAQRRLDRQDQLRILKELKEQEARLRSRAQALLDRLDHEWQTENQRQSPHPEPVPFFAKAVPVDPKRDYEERRQAYEDARTSATEQLAGQLAEVRGRRRETITAFRNANRNREQRFTRIRENLKAKQEKDFDKAFRKERALDASRAGREVFTRLSRSARSHDGRSH